MLITVAALLTACSRQRSEDYCSNHYIFHASHLDSIGNLDITHSADGIVRAEFSLPTSLFDENVDVIGPLIDILNDPDKVFSFQTEIPCAVNRIKVSSDAASIVANYQMDCGAETRIRQIDVLLFDIVDDLDEVESFITTPATQKRFAISRRCESPIFRLRASGD